MKTTNKLVLPLLVGMMTIGMIACKSGTETSQATADSLQAVITADSLAKVANDLSNDKKVAEAVGRAQPNPAKKNGKGVIVFQPDWQKTYEQQNAGVAIEMDKEGIYTRTEVRPSYPGGEKALAKFIQENIMYPEEAIENGVEGTVGIVFAVDERGKVYTPRIMGEKEGYGLDEAAINVVSKMPTWNPGQIKGVNVKSYYTLPITFRIN